LEITEQLTEGRRYFFRLGSEQSWGVVFLLKEKADFDLKLRPHSERMSRGDVLFERVFPKASRLFWSISMRQIRQKTSAPYSKKFKKRA